MLDSPGHLEEGKVLAAAAAHWERVQLMVGNNCFIHAAYQDRNRLQLEGKSLIGVVAKRDWVHQPRWGSLLPTQVLHALVYILKSAHTLHN